VTRRDLTAMLLRNTSPVASDVDHGSDVQQTVAKVMAHWRNTAASNTSLFTTTPQDYPGHVSHCTITQLHWLTKQHNYNVDEQVMDTVHCWTVDKLNMNGLIELRFYIPLDTE